MVSFINMDGCMGSECEENAEGLIEKLDESIAKKSEQDALDACEDLRSLGFGASVWREPEEV